MADSGNTNREVDKEHIPYISKAKPVSYENMRASSHQDTPESRKDHFRKLSTSEYCEKLQGWMWQYYTGYVNWQSWLSVSAMSSPPYLPQSTNETSTSPLWPADLSNFDAQNWFNNPFGLPLSPYPPAFVTPGSHTGDTIGNGPVPASVPTQPQQQHQQNGNAQRPGREYSIPSPLQRFLAEMVDFFILFFIKATIIISIMHLSGMKDISKFAMHFIVEEIDEDTSMEELQKMMLVALIYRILVCFYEIVCIWGAGGATPGKFIIGLRVITCDSSVLLQPNRVLVVPATNVSLTASTVRALNKNFSIAFFFPAFITLLFFQHNRTVYDMVAGTIVVKRTGAR
ncbi:protein FAM8A1-like isoform X1 [Hypomesus transpacificus]|uniref:protein FAM8A1-like isoform X1 n=1 Tax=Hypomesus transpacificus TaxID=137520 RepID=UPI001F084314|nr:protein FAM8A1-like isoform X1 [Hypomesus transpacificus]